MKVETCLLSETTKVMKLTFAILLITLSLSVGATACANPTDSFASEILLNKAGVIYDLTDIKNSKNITLQNDTVIYRSHYNPEVAVVLSVNEPFNKQLSIKLQVPVTQVQMKLPVVNIKAVETVDVASLNADAAKELGWNVKVSGKAFLGNVTRDSYSLEKRDISISLMPEGRTSLERTEAEAVINNATALTEDTRRDIEEVLVKIGFARREEVLQNAAVEAKIQEWEDLVPSVNVDADTFDFSGAMRAELTWLRNNKVISGLTDEDIDGIAKEAGKGIAGYNSRIVYFEGNWLPYRRTGQPLIKSVSGCGGFPLALLPAEIEKVSLAASESMGETFSLSIIEAFVNPQYDTRYSTNSGEGLAIFLILKTDAVYECANYKIVANTIKSADRIVVDIKGIQREQICLEAMGQATFSEKLGDLKGELDLILRYEGEEDRYKLAVSDESINITSLNSNFTHIVHPLSFLRIPKDVIWAECGHYDKIGCEENSQYTSVCQKFFKELEELGAEPFEPKNGTYAFAGFDRQNLRHFKYSGDASKLESLIKKYSIYTDRNIENKEKCTLLSINTWRGDWFYSWNEEVKGVQNHETGKALDQGTKGIQMPGFGIILSVISLLVVTIRRRKK